MPLANKFSLTLEKDEDWTECNWQIIDSILQDWIKKFSSTSSCPPASGTKQPIHLKIESNLLLSAVIDLQRVLYDQRVNLLFESASLLNQKDDSG